MKPLVIGIAGGTGSGKTTIAKNITRELPSSSIALIDHDSYYSNRTDLAFEERCLLNFDHPDSLETSLLIEHVKALRAGQAVHVPVYDFKTHCRKDQTLLVHPLPIVVVEGILVFADPELRSLFDMKIFVDTDADIRVFRRIRRDMEERGRTFESVREQYYKTVRPMHLQFVEPSKRWADIIIPEGGDNSAALDMITGKLKHVLANV
jgi:uridine kinase